MIKDASKIFEIMTEFCRNNLDIVIIGGAGIIMFILFVCGAVYFDKKENKRAEMNDTSSPEEKEVSTQEDSSQKVEETLGEESLVEEDLCEVKDPKEVESLIEKWKILLEEELIGNVVEDPELRVVDIVLPPLTARIMEIQETMDVQEDSSEEETKEELEQTVELDAEPVFDTEQKTIVYLDKSEDEKPVTIESLVQEIATISGTNVKEVEIKVAGAKVKITYVETDKESDTKDESLGKNDTYKESVGMLEDAQHEHRKQIDQINVPNERSVHKFGPDNINTARSGRVYSLEELEQQIKD